MIRRENAVRHGPRWSNRARRWTGIAALLLGAAPLVFTLVASAQVPQVWGRGFQQSWRVREGLPERRGGFTFCRLMYRTDIADGWEREGEDEAFFYAFSPVAYSLGINIVLWAMTH
jgi:hypothetical protein